MKKIEAIIKPFKLDEVRDALTRLGVRGMTVNEVEGCGWKNVRHSQNECPPVFSHKIKLEIVVADTLCEAVSGAIIGAANTGKIGDGHIFISNVEEAIRIRTQETGHLAVC